ncbi:MAG: four helix bundle protein [Planctomycetota bacterium]|nr:four helix bundle protein [Planctomycetota bacterium]
MRQEVALAERLLDFAVRVTRLVGALVKTEAGKHVAGQLLRSGTSPGANYEEACGAESRRDFCHKLGIVVKELKETRYWLRLVHRVPLVKAPDRMTPLMDEVEQLVAIFAKSVSTARRSRQTFAHRVALDNRGLDNGKCRTRNGR